MSRSITDARQITLRQFLQQITNASTYAGTADSKPANQAELDNLLAALNAEVTPLLRMSASSTPNLVVTVGAAILANPESSYTRSIPHIGALLPNNFTSGTVTFPASSGGTITVSPGNNGVLTVSSGNFIKVLVYMDTSGNLNVLSGTENASESAATVPKAPIDTLPLGYVTLQNTAGVIQNIAQNKIYQFYTGSGVTQTALDSEFVIKDVTDPTKQIGFDAAGTTNTKTTIAGSQTANRTLTLPDITDFLVTRTNAESLSNKVIAFSAANDNTSGSNITLASFNSGVIRLTNASLVSVSGLPAGTSGQLVIVENKTGAQVFINNEEVTATAANRILTGTNGSVPMPNNATFIFTYDATSSRWQLTGGSGSGTGSGGVNFITNGTADAGTTGWVTYADASASRPVDGTGGSPNVTWTTTTSSPLVGTNSFLFTKDVGDRRGQGVSYNFTIDPAYQAKVLTINAKYIVNSGTFAAGSPTADSDVIFYLYDITNAVLIEPSSFRLLSNSSTVSDEFSATFQTPFNSTSYRLIIHIASTSASAYSLKFDDIQVSPSKYVYGTPITDWVSTTTTSSWDSFVTWNSGRRRRVGDETEIHYVGTITSTPSGNFTLNTPAGTVIDTLKLPSGGISNLEPFGTSVLFDNSSGLTAMATVAANSSTSFRLRVDNSTSANVTPTSPFTWATGDQITVRASFPTVGLSSSVQVSDGADTRAVVMQARRGADLSIPNGSTTTVTGYTTLTDSHGQFNPTTGIYTFGKGGRFRVYGQVSWVNSTTGFRVVAITKNGSPANESHTAGNSNSFTQDVVFEGDFVAGDTVRLGVFQNSGTSINITNAVTSAGSAAFYISSIPGSSTIAANADVVATGTNTAGTTLTANTIVQIPFVATNNTTGSWGTNNFTAPTSGLYYAQVLVTTGTVTLTSLERFNAYIYKNGSLIAQNNTLGNGASNNYFSSVTTVVRLNAGETLDFRAQIANAGGSSLIVSAALNNFSIFKIGS